jgi:hypothetical protein
LGLGQDAVSYVSDLNDPTVEEVCQVLQLGDHLAKFQREQFTFGDLLLLSEEDLASLGLPMGPRKRLLTYLRDLEIRRAKLKQVERMFMLGFRHFRVPFYHYALSFSAYFSFFVTVVVDDLIYLIVDSKFV